MRQLLPKGLYLRDSYFVCLMKGGQTKAFCPGFLQRLQKGELVISVRKYQERPDNDRYDIKEHKLVSIN